jgi:hypothetical protein
MVVYQLIDRLSRDPESRDQWIIERAIPGGPPIRLLFQGTRREAQSEVGRLNAFLKRKTGTPGPRAVEVRDIRTHVNVLTASFWSAEGSGFSSRPD